ncbi:non-ribosomal peptide synthetase [Mesobacillus foraminis]|uniref:non-ribosomal peptide synthetase n=1 Tax=Mesobacillus foraminis TaxID=279826 RepID=UPI000EF5580A|nr:non-ribosomal peptide synthetase [Mesobacillus foraminis]
MFNKKNVKDLYRLSPMQHGILFHCLNHPKDHAYFEQLTMAIEGHLDVENLEVGLNWIVEKHDVLRTVFLYSKVKEPTQLVLQSRKASVQMEDISFLNEDDKQQFIDTLKREDREKGFDLSRDLLFRLTVVQTGSHTYQLLFSFHHIILDGWSIGLLLKELFGKYSQLQCGHPGSNLRSNPFSVYIRWLEQQNEGEAKRFWADYMSGYDGLTGIPYKQSNLSREFRREELQFSLNPVLTRKLEELAKSRHVTLNVVCQTLWGLLLQKLNDKDDVIFGSVVSGRPSDIPRVEEIAGLFINTLPVRISASGSETIAEVIDRVQHESLETKNHDFVSLADIQSSNREGGSVFDHLFVFENYPMDPGGLDGDPGLGFRITGVKTFEQTNYDLVVQLHSGEELNGKVTYNGAAYPKELVNRLPVYLQRLAEVTVETPFTSIGNINLATKEELQILEGWNHTSEDYPRDKVLPELFEEQAITFPDQTAIVFRDRTMTYREVNEKANQIARRLEKQGVSQGKTVALLMERSAEMILGILGILKAGAAYLPIDPSYPVERVQFMVEDSGAGHMVVGERRLVPTFFEGQTLVLEVDEWTQEAKDNPIRVNTPEDTAYLIYTSGTTGRPKGCQISHRNVIKTVKNNGYIEITPEDTLLQLANYAFDGSVFDIYSALLNGARLVIAPKEATNDLKKIARLLEEESITVSFMTTALFNLIVDEQISCLRKLRKVLIGGEKASVHHVRKAVRHLGDNRVINGYGPTETTVFAVTYEADHQIKHLENIPIGRPMNNTLLYVVGRSGDLLPIGVPGELYIGGDGVGKGYLNQSELTNKYFVDNPFGSGKVYKTGDLVRWLPNGILEYLGRMDQQVKLRGHRIELSEIEHKLAEYPGIQNCVVTLREGPGGSYLCAYYVSYLKAETFELKGFLQEKVPDFMVPATFVHLEELPLTSNGKVDKRALPTPRKEGVALGASGPGTETERIIAEIWKDILGVARVGIDDNFFDLGGHSLKATQLTSRLHKELKVELPLKAVFSSPSIRELADYIQATGKGTFDRIPSAGAREYYPATSSQRRIYLAEQLLDHQKNTSYNVPSVFEVGGNLDLQQLEYAFTSLIHRHDSLRTSIISIEGEIVQQVHEVAKFTLEIMECAEDEAERVIDEFIRPFDITEAPLIRAGVVRLGSQRHLLMVDLHHIITDGISMSILMQELAELYMGNELPELTLQFKDYAAWMESQAQKERLHKQKAFWTDIFQNEMPVLDIPTDYARPVERDHRGDISSFTLSPDLQLKLKNFSAEHGATLFMTFLAAYHILLSKYTGQKDIAIGTAVAGRSHADTDGMVGMFAHTIPLRNYSDERWTFTEFLHDVKQMVLQSFEHADYPIEDLVDQIGRNRSLDRNILFDTMLTFQNMDSTKLDFSGLHIQSYPWNWKNAKFDLNWIVVEDKDLRISIEYSTALFKKETIDRMQGHFQQVLLQIVSTPEIQISEIQLVGQEETSILLDFSGRKNNYPRSKVIQEIFEEKAAETPNQIAISMGTRLLTYQELNEQANQVAWRLRKKGMNRCQTVGLLMERSPEMIVAMLGSLKAGGTYVPIDPSYPAERIHFMLEDSQADFLLAQDEPLIPEGYLGQALVMRDREWAEEDNQNLPKINEPVDAAYIIYTSGSTGQPKGNLTSHQNVIKTIINNGYIEILDTDRILQLSNYAFDGSVFDIYSALLNGATLVLIQKDKVLDIKALSEYLQSEDISVSFMTAALFNALVDLELACLKGMRKILFGGEKASPIHVRKAFDYLGKQRLINGYGPTETTVFAATYAVDSAVGSTIPIGKPLNNTCLYVMNQQMQLQPIGVPGELCIGGEGVGKGYLNLPKLTAERFVKDPFGSGTLYRTGDWVRWLPDGNIEYLGRMDDQIKLRGHRIELGEIEAKILDNPNIQNAVVTMSSSDQYGAFLCAYVVSDEGWSEQDLLMHLKEKLPEYMVPASFVRMDRLPLTPNGKVDTRALPQPLRHRGPGARHEQPEGMEIKMADIWKELLGVETVSRQDNFFQLGGHSLKASVLSHRIQKEFNKEVSLRDIFTSATLEKMTRLVSQSKEMQYEAIHPVEEKPFYPVSSAQRRMYAVNMLEGTESEVHYNMPIVMEIKGDLDANLLESALKSLVNRHESLRTSFHLEKQELTQKVHPEVGWSMDFTQVGEGELQELITSFIQPFDLSCAPLFRAQLVKLEENRFILMLDMHHIISDGVSAGVLLEDLSQMYQGKRLPELAVQYKDYVCWQRESAILEEQKIYWLDRLSGELPALDLPTDYKRPKVQSFEGKTSSFELTADDFAKLKDTFLTGDGTTMYMVLLAAYHVLLSKYTNQDDILIGTPVAGRPHAELEPVVGMFVNSLVIRNHSVGNQSFQEFVTKVKHEVLNAFENADLPIEEILEHLDFSRTMDRNPLFDTMFTLQNIDTPIEIPGLQIGPFKWNWTSSKFDMTWAFAEKETLQFTVEYKTSLFKKSTVETMARHYIHILNQIARHPDSLLADIELLTDREKQQLLQKNHTIKEYPKEQTLQGLFERQAADKPEKIALVFDHKNLTYGELNGMANRIAHSLLKHGVKRGQTVGLMAERSFGMIASMLGILKAGAAYLPIDPGFPAERIQYMVEDSGTQLVLLQGVSLPGTYDGKVLTVEEALLERNSSNPGRKSGPEDLAYVVYTSGSTGMPKGNLTTHRNVIRTIINNGYLEVEETDRFLQLSNYAFDGSTFDIYAALLHGARLVLVPKDTVTDAVRLSRLIREEQVTVSFMTTALFNTLVDVDLECLKGLRKLLFGGEMVSVKHVRRAYRAMGEGRLIHVYGPTETTVFATACPVTASVDDFHTVPIGKPISNTSAYVLSPSDQLQPEGIPGELAIGGAGVSLGYLNLPDLNKERFVDNPFVPGDVIYKTGDLVRWLPDGNLEYLGRIDQQVKIRGHRIELGEVENRLLSFNSVVDATVVANRDENGQSYLCAYLVTKGEWDIPTIRRHLKEALPDYMIPSYFVEVGTFPLTPNGKIDKKALPEPSSSRPASEDYTAPLSDREKLLASVWEEVLRNEQVGLHDNFFEMGGDSIKAIQIAARLNEHGLKFAMKDLFKNPTVYELAPCIQSAADAAEQGPILGDVPLTPIQHWFFEQSFPAPEHFNQSMMLFREDGWNGERVKDAFRKLCVHHDALRMVYPSSKQHSRGLEEIDFTLQRFDFRWASDVEALIEKEANNLQAGLNPADGPIMGLGIFETANGSYLLIVIHHLVVDGVSWRILLEDFSRLYEKGEALPPKTTSYQAWAKGLVEYAGSPALQKEIQYWEEVESMKVPSLPKDGREDGSGGKMIELSFSLTKEETHQLLTEAHRAYQTEINDLLLAALALTVREWTGKNRLAVSLEGHGREDLVEGADLSRTVGWFTSMFPVVFDVSSSDLGHTVKEVKETLRKVPHKGAGYGVLRYLNPAVQNKIKHTVKPEISFNYLGRFEDGNNQAFSSMPMGIQVSPLNHYSNGLDFNSVITAGQLTVHVRNDSRTYHYKTLEQVIRRFEEWLKAIVRHCAGKEETEKTPSDFSDEELTFEELDAISQLIDNL